MDERVVVLLSALDLVEPLGIGEAIATHAFGELFIQRSPTCTDAEILACVFKARADHRAFVAASTA